VIASRSAIITAISTVGLLEIRYMELSVNPHSISEMIILIVILALRWGGAILVCWFGIKELKDIITLDPIDYVATVDKRVKTFLIVAMIGFALVALSDTVVTFIALKRGLL
jgi:arginine exporter protein ArgO